MVSLRNVYQLLKNLPGKIIMFYSAQSFLQNQTMLGICFSSNFCMFINMVPQSAPEALPTEQQFYDASSSLNVFLFFDIICIFECRYSSFYGFSNIYLTDACIIVCGIKTMLNILRSEFCHCLNTYCFAQTINHPNLHPGPSHLLVKPEHLNMVTSQVANSANVLDGSPQVTPQQISSAKIGKFFFLANYIIYFLCSSAQHVPSGLDGSFTQINLVRSSTKVSIYLMSAFQSQLGLRRQNLILRPMLSAMTPANGKPGEGNKKLSPSFANSLIVAQIARLPPAVMNTFYLLRWQLGDEKIVAIFQRASSHPTNLVYPSILPTFLFSIQMLEGSVLNQGLVVGSPIERSTAFGGR